MNRIVSFFETEGLAEIAKKPQLPIFLAIVIRQWVGMSTTDIRKTLPR
jgi:hypothetical protein